MFETGKDPKSIVKEKGLIQISDEGELKGGIIEKVLDENEQSIIDYKNGKDRAIGYLIGQIMKATRGKANPQLVNKMLTEMLKIDRETYLFLMRIKFQLLKFYSLLLFWFFTGGVCSQQQI